MNIDELIPKINSAIFKVNKILGAGFLEEVYKNALLVELRNMGLNTKVQVPTAIHYEGEVVGEYFADIVVEDKVVLSLKAVDYFEPIHEAQILNYLHASKYNAGLLVNFTYPKAIIKKIVP